MAEVVIGIVSGGLTFGAFAVQVGSSIKKLKTLFDDVREAPDNVRVLIKGIDGLHLVLRDIEQEYSQYTGVLSDSYTTSHDNCQFGAQRLKDLVEGLTEDLNAKKRLNRLKTAFKLILEKDKIARYQSELGEVKATLALAQSCYQIAMSQRVLSMQHSLEETIVQKFAELALAGKMVSETDEPQFKATTSTHTTSQALWKYSGPSPSKSWLSYLLGDIYKSSTNAQEYERRLAPRQRKNSKIRVVCARYKMPGWLSYKVGEAIGLQTQAGWTINLRCYNIVPSDSLVFQYAKSGDIDGLWQLFIENKASINDRDVDGRTPLRLAIESRELSTTQFLLEQGADILLGVPVPALGLIVIYADERDPVQTFREIVRLICSRPEHELSEADIGYLGFFGGRPAEFALVLELGNPLYDAPMSDRIDAAIELSIRGNIECARMVLGSDFMMMKTTELSLPSNMYHRLASGYALLSFGHFTVRRPYNRLRSDQVGTAIDIGETVRTEAETNKRNLYRHLLHISRPTIQALASLDYFRMTPLTSVLEIFFSSPYRNRFNYNEILRRIITIFLEDLSNAGVDLMEYGAKETSLLRTGCCCQDFQLRPSWLRSNKWVESEIRLIGITYGPQPADWKFWFSEPSDEYAGDFWYLVEPFEGSIPGAWID